MKRLSWGWKLWYLWHHIRCSKWVWPIYTRICRFWYWRVHGKRTLQELRESSR